MLVTNRNKTPLNYSRAVSIGVGIATVWVFFEWLFLVTKPSFMNLYSVWEKAGVLAGTALVMSVMLVLGSLPFLALGWVLNRYTAYHRLVSLVSLFPAIVLAAFTLLLLIDNFMLTMVGWGIRNALLTGIWLFRVLTIALLIYTAGLLHYLLSKREISAAFRAVAVAVGLIVVSGVPLLLKAVVTTPEVADEGVTLSGRERPNILILSGDGIWAQHMSVYGYERPTTPFMDSVQDEFLIAENHFSNASDTGGSVVSMLTGKYPTTTRVIYPPDVLRGTDSFQHLPGLLKQLGYYNVDISMRHYADPYDLNMRDGFAEANFRKLTDTGILPVTLIRSYPQLNSIALMTNQISERLLQRLGHIWRNQPMLDPMAEVNKPDKRFIRDDARMVEIRRLIKAGQQPFFMHVHMMGTHGTRFRPRKRIYSNESSYTTKWDEDGYDDAIIDFDRYVRETYELLEAEGLLDSTIFIISSDHGFRKSPLHRLPMMMRLPGLVRKGWVGGNTQRLDIAPTLLNVIGIVPPAWMEGQSFLEADSSELAVRPIFASASNAEKSANGIFWSVINPQPPWFSMGKLFLVSCDQGFSLHLDSMKMQEFSIDGSTLECAESLTKDAARKILLAHLKERGYP